MSTDIYTHITHKCVILCRTDGVIELWTDCIETCMYVYACLVACMRVSVCICFCFMVYFMIVVFIGSFMIVYQT